MAAVRPAGPQPRTAVGFNRRNRKRESRPRRSSARCETCSPANGGDNRCSPSRRGTDPQRPLSWTVFSPESRNGWSAPSTPVGRDTIVPTQSSGGPPRWGRDEPLLGTAPSMTRSTPADSTGEVDVIPPLHSRERTQFRAEGAPRTSDRADEILARERLVLAAAGGRVVGRRRRSARSPSVARPGEDPADALALYSRAGTSALIFSRTFLPTCLSVSKSPDRLGLGDDPQSLQDVGEAEGVVPERRLVVEAQPRTVLQLSLGPGRSRRGR